MDIDYYSTERGDQKFSSKILLYCTTRVRGIVVYGTDTFWSDNTRYTPTLQEKAHRGRLEDSADAEGLWVGTPRSTEERRADFHFALRFTRAYTCIYAIPSESDSFGYTVSTS